MWSPCVCVMNIFWMRPIFTADFWIWCCVASPQSKSQTSPSSRSASAEWLRVEDGCADADGEDGWEGFGCKGV